MNNLSPEEAVAFLEDYRLMVSNKNKEHVKLEISLPKSIVNVCKFNAKESGETLEGYLAELLRVAQTRPQDLKK